MGPGRRPLTSIGGSSSLSYADAGGAGTPVPGSGASLVSPEQPCGNDGVLQTSSGADAGSGNVLVTGGVNRDTAGSDSRADCMRPSKVAPLPRCKRPAFLQSADEAFAQAAEEAPQQRTALVQLLTVSRDKISALAQAAAPGPPPSR